MALREPPTPSPRAVPLAVHPVHTCLPPFSNFTSAREIRPGLLRKYDFSTKQTVCEPGQNKADLGPLPTPATSGRGAHPTPAGYQMQIRVGAFGSDHRFLASKPEKQNKGNPQVSRRAHKHPQGAETGETHTGCSLFPLGPLWAHPVLSGREGAVPGAPRVSPPASEVQPSNKLPRRAECDLRGATVSGCQRRARGPSPRQSPAVNRSLAGLLPVSFADAIHPQAAFKAFVLCPESSPSGPETPLCQH